MKVSQVITTFNRAKLLDNNFNRLVQLTLPDEILVIDDGGSDETEIVCQKWSEHLPIRYIYNNNPGPSICSLARNIGVKQSKYDFILTCEPELIYVTDIIARFKDIYNDRDIISSGVVWFQPHARMALPQPHQLDENYEPTDWQRQDGWVAPYTALWNKEWVEAVGGWDEEFPGSWGWDDIDLLTRLRITGHGQFIDLKSKVLHQFHGLGGDVDFINEHHFKSKSFCHGDESDHRDLVANKGFEWGKIRT